MSLKVCSFLFFSYLLFAMPCSSFAGGRDDAVDKELIAKQTATVIEGMARSSDKLLALHSFVSKTIKEVPTSYN